MIECLQLVFSGNLPSASTACFCYIYTSDNFIAYCKTLPHRKKMTIALEAHYNKLEANQRQTKKILTEALKLITSGGLDHCFQTKSSKGLKHDDFIGDTSLGTIVDIIACIAKVTKEAPAKETKKTPVKLPRVAIKPKPAKVVPVEDVSEKIMPQKKTKTSPAPTNDSEYSEEDSEFEKEEILIKSSANPPTRTSQRDTAAKRMAAASIRDNELSGIESPVTEPPVTDNSVADNPVAEPSVDGISEKLKKRGRPAKAKPADTKEITEPGMCQHIYFDY
jgi:hypothetical protein